MKKHISCILVLASLSASAFAGDCAACPDQRYFPKILCQPEDQMVPMGSNATFTVVATNGPLAYQWTRSGATMDGQTNSSLTIKNAQIKDVGLYSCYVFQDTEAVPTRAASLMVYTNTVDANGVDPIVVYGTPLSGNGGQGTSCPGPYVGYITYYKTAAQGWGWAPDVAHTTVFTATDTNRTDTKVEYVGNWGDSGCARTAVTVPYPPMSTAYRFAIYFTNNVPTNAYAITLDGFLP